MNTFDDEVKGWEWQWVHEHQSYPIKPSGDPVKVSKEMYKKYRKIIAGAYQVE
jgi:alpha-N-acetylglucosaminidase